jgi:NAD(P)-dependent dehydrogenase (short-subunit alcohol dehydrogenase family)
VSAIETATDEEFRTQLETNFWGVVNVSRAAIPLLRDQGGGLLMQVHPGQAESARASR